MTADPHNNNGVGSYTYDAVGNRKTLSSTTAVRRAACATATMRTIDLASDQYDADGNTINSVGHREHLRLRKSPDHARRSDARLRRRRESCSRNRRRRDDELSRRYANPTGYAQVVDELISGTVTRTYSTVWSGSARTRSLNSAPGRRVSTAMTATAAFAS